MRRRARLWTGVTLIAVILFNYGAIGYPLYRKSVSIREKYRDTLIKQAKSSEPFRIGDSDYLIEIFRNEKASLDRKMLLLNCAALSLFIIAASWTVFGLFTSKK